MSKMRACFFQSHGGTSQLEYGYIDTPKPGPHEVLVKVKACALNHLDVWALAGMPGVKISMPHILGCDIAGEIAAVGSKVKDVPLRRPVVIAPGICCGKCEYCLSGWDSLCPQYKIMGFQVNGGYAEYVTAPAENIIQVSRKKTFEQWASVPLVFLTAWHMLVTLAKLQKKESVLIHSAGSGVGSASIQIAKLLGAQIFTTVGHENKIKKAKELGADHVIVYSQKDFQEEIFRITKGRGVDVVIEHVGKDTFTKSLHSLAKRGRLITCGATTGPLTEINLRYVFSKQLTILGSYMGSQKELKQILRLVKHKKLNPVIDKVFPLREARKALDRLLARENFGKIILTP